MRARTVLPVGSIVLAGHSGAYRVMAFILNRGGLTANIREVYLFDALYGQTEKFAHWVDRFPGKLVDIYTAEGGTRDQSLDFMDDLGAWDIPFVAVPESAVTQDFLLIRTPTDACPGPCGARCSGAAPSWTPST